MTTASATRADSTQQLTTRSAALALVVDDSAAVRALIRQSLELDGVEVAEAADGEEAIAAALARPPDVVLLDIFMPTLDGLTVLSRIRQTSSVPVILVTRCTTEDDRVRGLDLGADDYLVKPFSPKELGARVRSVLRRTRRDQPSGLVFGDLTIDLGAREVRLGGAVVSLTRKEFDLLVTLASAPREVFSRSQLLRIVWGSQEAWQTTATVTEHIRRVRLKIEADPMQPRWLQTVRRAGYRFDG